jgi:hypothetical protein
MGSDSFYAFSRFMSKTVASPCLVALSAKSCAAAQRVQWNGSDLIKGSVYAPFGPNGGWTWGNRKENGIRHDPLISMRRRVDS